MLMADYHSVINEETAEMFRAEQRFYENGGTNTERLKKQYSSRLQSSDDISYEVYAEATKLGEYVDVELFIKNTGDNRALGNSTFGLEYDPSKLVFDTYFGQDKVVFSSAEGKANNYGYSKAYSNPTATTIDPIPGLRTVDIIYAQDAPSSIHGVDIPNQKTSLGILRFKVNRTADYEFKWHRITNVNDVDGNDITKYGEFMTIEGIMLEKTASISYPTAGMDLSPNKSYNILWTEPDFGDMMIDILFSSDAGANWQTLNEEPVQIEAQEFYWTTPDINSTNCLLKLQVHETGDIIDEMANTFAIINSPVDIVKPCRICGTLLGGSESEIVWEAERDDDVYFEFSADGLKNWEVITETFNCDRLSVVWNVPEIDTYNAVVRMKTGEGEVIATSTPFAILNGALNLTYPDGMIISGGKKIDISWMYDNVNDFDLYFSNDGGNSWEEIAGEVNASVGRYRWPVPNIDCENAMLKACFTDNEELEYHRVQFLITKTSTSGVNDPSAVGYTLSGATPNPFSESATMTFSVPQRERVSAAVYDITGNKVATLFENRVYASGKHTIRLSGGNLPTGTYIVYVTAGSYTMTQKVTVIK
jgi:hypothetical protein